MPIDTLVSHGIEACHNPNPLDTMDGITLTWEMFERIRDGLETVQCPFPKNRATTGAEP